MLLTCFINMHDTWMNWKHSFFVYVLPCFHPHTQECLWDTLKNQKPIVSWFFNKIVITNYKDFLKMIICNSHQTKTFEGSNCSIMSQKCPCIWLFNLCLLLEYLFSIKMVNCVCVCVCVCVCAFRKNVIFKCFQIILHVF